MRSASVDKCVELRKDGEWQKKVLKSNKTLVFPIWRNCNLMKLGDGKVPEGVLKPLNLELISLSNQIVFLGVENNIPLIAIDLSNLESEEVNARFSDGIFKNLLAVRSILSTHHGPLMAYARGLIHWNNNSCYCGKCGSKTESLEFGHIRMCVNKSCGNILYPRLEPSVIVLVEQFPKMNGTPKCLLARHVRIPTFWTTLAGFVEFGEQIEETVCREVFEEVGLKVSDIQYVSSQPWPFPSSLMLGFRAKTSELTINLDSLEIAEAKWFSITELKKGIADGSIIIPGDFTIAYRLISDWIKENE